MTQSTTTIPVLTIGLDLGDRQSVYATIDRAGALIDQGRVEMQVPAVEAWAARYPACRIALEAGTHSAWIARILQKQGHEVVVANPRRLHLISKQTHKSDENDAQLLARVARMDIALLSPVQPRKESTQRDLTMLRARDLLVQQRTAQINHVRSSLKPYGLRVPPCSAEAFPKRAAAAVPEDKLAVFTPMLEMIAASTAKIRNYDAQIERLCEETYPQTRVLRQVRGVGPLTALIFVLIVEDPHRFQSSRDAAAFLGLVPKRHQSGGADPQLRITKTGDRLARRCLVTSANYILGHFGTDCDLRRFGERIAARGGRNAKKRARVAVARKLAVLLHRLWITGEQYEPLRYSDQAQAA